MLAQLLLPLLKIKRIQKINKGYERSLFCNAEALAGCLSQFKQRIVVSPVTPQLSHSPKTILARQTCSLSFMGYLLSLIILWRVFMHTRAFVLKLATI